MNKRESWYFDPHAETLAPKALAALQLRRLRKTLHDAYENVPLQYPAKSASVTGVGDRLVGVGEDRDWPQAATRRTVATANNRRIRAPGSASR